MNHKPAIVTLVPLDACKKAASNPIQISVAKEPELWATMFRGLQPVRDWSCHLRFRRLHDDGHRPLRTGRSFLLTISK